MLAKPCFLPGFFFIPDVHAHVWVEFIAGNTEDAIWSGVCYPTDASPRTTSGKAPTEFQKILRTSSGHVIEFDDSKDSEALTISDPTNGNVVRMNADGIRLEGAGNTITMNGGGITVEDTNGNRIAMEATGIKMTSGAGQMQFVVLAPIIEWLQAHQHTGNMGAPTPLFPANLKEIDAKNQAGTIKSGTGD